MNPATTVHAEEHDSEAKKVEGNLLKTLLFSFVGLVIIVLAFIYIPRWLNHSPNNDTTSVTQNTTQTVNLSKLTKETGLVDVKIPESGEIKVTMNVVNGHYQKFNPTCPDKITFIDPGGKDYPFKGNRFLKEIPDSVNGWYLLKGKPGTLITFEPN